MGPAASHGGIRPGRALSRASSPVLGPRRPGRWHPGPAGILRRSGWGLRPGLRRSARGHPSVGGAGVGSADLWDPGRVSALQCAAPAPGSAGGAGESRVPPRPRSLRPPYRGCWCRGTGTPPRRLHLPALPTWALGARLAHNPALTQKGSPFCQSTGCDTESVKDAEARKCLVGRPSWECPGNPEPT